MSGLVLRITAVDGARPPREVPIGPGERGLAEALRNRVAGLPSVREGRRRVEIVAAGDRP